MKLLLNVQVPSSNPLEVSDFFQYIFDVVNFFEINLHYLCHINVETISLFFSNSKKQHSKRVKMLKIKNKY